ncbi:hypothetical protein [Clostridium sp.]|uniref:hypothetical protein n=1 Tax=Clostridium sp. TaxID=1506 RepID=UPI002FC901DB
MSNIKFFYFPQDILLFLVSFIALLLFKMNLNLALSIFFSLAAVVLFTLWIFLKLKRFKETEESIRIVKLLEIQVLESTEIIQQMFLYLNNNLKISTSNIIINNEWFDHILILRKSLTEGELRQIIDLMYHFDSLQKNYNHWANVGDDTLRDILKSNLSPGTSELVDEVNSVRNIVIKLKLNLFIN